MSAPQECLLGWRGPLLCRRGLLRVEPALPCIRPEEGMLSELERAAEINRSCKRASQGSDLGRVGCERRNQRCFSAPLPPAQRENDAFVPSKLDSAAYSILHAHRQRWWIGPLVPAPILLPRGPRGSASQPTGIPDLNSEANCIRVVKGRPD